MLPVDCDPYIYGIRNSKKCLYVTKILLRRLRSIFLKKYSEYVVHLQGLCVICYPGRILGEL